MKPVLFVIALLFGAVSAGACSRGDDRQPAPGVVAPDGSPVGDAPTGTDSTSGTSSSTSLSESPYGTNIWGHPIKESPLPEE